MHWGRWKSALAIICLLLMAGCAITLEQRRQTSIDLLAASGWQRQDLVTEHFRLASWHSPDLQSAARVRVYIEGDGLAWRDRYSPSDDPTPLDPFAFKLAQADPSAEVLYLARPCQFPLIDTPHSCDQRYWTSHRFAEEVIAANDAALDIIKARTSAESFELVGYSGGAAVALLLAARRDDVRRIITVAGNLDHAHWTEREGYTPLWGSLNPTEFAAQIAEIPQTHFIGARDRTIIPTDAAAYQSQLPPGHRSEVIVIDDFSHHCCWADAWAELLNRIP